MAILPSVIQIIPRLGSPLDGVSDYACALGDAIRAHEGLALSFVIADPSQTLSNPSDAILAFGLKRRSAKELISTLAQATLPQNRKNPGSILVHYVNYGYETRGCPFWLIAGLKAWKRREPDVRLVSMFHEIYALGAPWRSSFWLSPVQRHLARSLFRISDAAVTNRAQSKQWLIRGSPAYPGTVSVMPVFSTLGEAESSISWRERSPQIVVVGRTGAADRAYDRCRDKLLEACRALEIEEILDIGARVSPVPSRIGGIRVSELGHLAPAQASAVIAKARAGFIDYPSDFLGKSTIFAAYAAHGLLPVVTWRRGPDETGLKEGFNYWVPVPGNRISWDFEAIAKRATKWYADHCLKAQARQFGRLLRGEVA